jgi:DNA replication protein DnaC
LPTSLTAKCLGCGREFATEQVVLLGQTFAADRYCALCRAAEEVAGEQRLAEMRWARVGVPGGYEQCRFENFEPAAGTTTAVEVCKQWVKEYRAGTALHRGLLLRGRPGAGKTHLAVAMLNQLVWSDHPRSALFINVPQWLDALRESYGEGEPPPSPSGFDILALDDLGAEDSSTPWTRDRIYQILNQREQERLLMIVTTNCNWGELAGRIGGPSASRLRRLCRDIDVDAQRDFREVLVERNAA